ncbi:unnamed protein product [Lymnaea stagnalis]|uniref:EF-hand domain-containing protein n=1 Tax=Lymnaea stagnalis TaxID=6523 RepID=A0AAV2I891_LYMST
MTFMLGQMTCSHRCPIYGHLDMVHKYQKVDAVAIHVQLLKSSKATQPQNMIYSVALLIALPALITCQLNVNALAVAAFNKLDSNGDGHFSRSDVDHYFRTLDANNDHIVTRPEYVAAIDAQFGDDAETLRALRQLFDDLDSNNDNHLDRTDYDHLFNVVDADNNGQATQQEFSRWFHAAVGGSVLG